MTDWFDCWGWPKPIMDIYQRAWDDIAETGASPEYLLELGPSHIVWSDANFENEHAEFCLAACDKPEWSHWGELLDIVRRSLRELIALPDVLKVPPKGYEDDEDNLPENFPPTHGVEMVKTRFMASIPNYPENA